MAGDTQLPAGLVRVDVLLRMEGGEVTTDDLVSLVALQATGASVPREDVSPRIEREDGVVAHSFDEQPVKSAVFVDGIVGGFEFLRVGHRMD